MFNKEPWPWSDIGTLVDQVYSDDDEIWPRSWALMYQVGIEDVHFAWRGTDFDTQLLAEEI